MRRLLLAALLLPLAAPFASTSSAAAACTLDLERRNSWHEVSRAGAVAMADGDPCRLLHVDNDHVSVSDDGGRSYRAVAAAPDAPSRLVASSLPSGSAFLLSRQGSLWRTADGGRTWTKPSGLSGTVLDVSVDQQKGQRVLAVAVAANPLPALPVPAQVPVPAGSALFVSEDGGRSFTSVTGATGLPLTTAAIDAVLPNRWWVAGSGPAGGLFVSDDAGFTFTPVTTGSVTGLAPSRIAGGGSQLLAATSDGLVLTRDGGRTNVKRLAGTAFTSIAMEWNHSSAALLVAGTVRRTSDTGVSAREQSNGLPSGCSPSDLRADRTQPSVFLATCADGSTWRYRSDGTDLSSTDAPDDGVPDPIGGQGLNGTPPRQMRTLGSRSLPSRGSRQDGSIAFDGVALYYTDQATRGLIHRMVARTGAALPDVKVDGPGGLTHIAYDANRDVLYVQDTSGVIWSVELPSGTGMKLFTSPMVGTGSMTYDSATERLLFASDHGDGIQEYDLHGTLRHSCPSLNLAQLLYLTGNVEGPDIAALVATGDGLLYVQSEDDSTVVRADRSCHVLAGYQHPQFSEAPAENDAIACDTVTFPGETAIWIRNASAGTVTAFAVDEGYCALPSTVAVTAPPGVAQGHAGTVCAHLVTTAKHLPIGHVPVDVLVAGRGIGSPLTNAQGTACTAYVPLPGEAGAGAGTAATRQPVLAAFLGTAAYRPSSARASLLVSRVLLPPPPPIVAQPAPQPVVVAPPPPLPVQPPPPPPNIPQTQPMTQPQGHPGAQPGAMGQLGAAAMPDDEAEAAAQGADTHLMSAYRGSDWAPAWQVALLPSAFGVLAFGAVQRRRRASRVRDQSA